MISGTVKRNGSWACFDSGVTRHERWMDMDKPVSYRSGDNSFLRLALLKAWKNKCYWCQKPVDYAYTQIDHIIPQSLNGEELATSLVNLGLSQDFSVHAVYNLAPICTPCNGPGEKGKTFDPDVPVFVTKLAKARKLKEVVNQDVQSMKNSPVEAENFIKVAEMSLDNPVSKALFQDYAPSIVQKLANLRPNALDYTTATGIELNPSGRSSYLDVFLDDRGRMTKGLIDGIIEQSFDSILNEVVSSLDSDIHQKVADAFASLPLDAFGEDPREPSVEGWIDSGKITVLRAMDFSRDDSLMEFTFAGSCSADYIANVTRQSSDSDSIESGQSNVSVDFEWRVTASWDGLWDSLVEIIEPEILECDVDSHIGWT